MPTSSRFSLAFACGKVEPHLGEENTDIPEKTEVKLGDIHPGCRGVQHNIASTFFDMSVLIIRSRFAAELASDQRCFERGTDKEIDFPNKDRCSVLAASAHKIRPRPLACPSASAPLSFSVLLLCAPVNNREICVLPSVVPSRRRMCFHAQWNRANAN